VSLVVVDVVVYVGCSGSSFAFLAAEMFVGDADVFESLSQDDSAIERLQPGSKIVILM
jgi:hypothetical protein